MVYDITKWMQDFTLKVKDKFGARLLFCGLQGSYRRGEATENSDIDMVTVLDRLDLRDLQTYKEIINTMEHSEKCCGFISAKEELANWPKADLFQFCKDTQPFYGALENIAPPVSRADIALAVKTGCANIYHAACHSYLYAQDKAAVLGELYKGTFFVLLAAHYLKIGKYAASKKELLQLLSGEDKEILYLSSSRQDLIAAVDENYQKLIAWCGGYIKREI